MSSLTVGTPVFDFGLEQIFTKTYLEIYEEDLFSPTNPNDFPAFLDLLENVDFDDPYFWDSESEFLSSLDNEVFQNPYFLSEALSSFWEYLHEETYELMYKWLHHHCIVHYDVKGELHYAPIKDVW